MLLDYCRRGRLLGLELSGELREPAGRVGCLLLREGFLRLLVRELGEGLFRFRGQLLELGLNLLRVLHPSYAGMEIADLLKYGNFIDIRVVR